MNIRRKVSAVESRLHKNMGQNVEPFGIFQSSSSVEHMQIPIAVAFKVAFIEKLKGSFRSSEGYLEPDRISTMKLLAANFRKKAPS